MTTHLWNRICLALSFVGTFIAGYLSLSYVMHVTIPCGAGGGCDKVAQSTYGHFFGIPTPIYGLGAYVALAALFIMRPLAAPERRRQFTSLAVGISLAGTLVSMYLLYLASAVLHDTCLWCIASGVTMALLFLSTSVLSQQEDLSEPAGKVDFKSVLPLGVLLLAGMGFRFTDLKSMASGDRINDAVQKLNLKIGDLVTDQVHQLGPNDAPVTIVEFGDLTCPHCKRSYKLLSHVVAQSEGKVRFIFRHHPMGMLPGHEFALPGAVVSEIAAEKGKFWQFVDAIFSVDKPEELSAIQVGQICNQIGVNSDEVLKRIDDTNDPAYQRVQTDIALGQKLGINSTPTLFVGLPGEVAQVATPSSLNDILHSAKYAPFVKGL